jgi:hypothetical protein
MINIKLYKKQDKWMSAVADLYSFSTHNVLDRIETEECVQTLLLRFYKGGDFDMSLTIYYPGLNVKLNVREDICLI